MKVGTIALLAVSVVIAAPVLQNQAFSTFAFSGDGPVFSGDDYLERCRRLHPDQPVMTPREFERWRSEITENQPNTRCC